MKGTIVSSSAFSGISKASGKKFTIHTNYVVNGGGKPEQLKIAEVENPYKVGQKIEIPVTCEVFRGEAAFYPERN